MKSIKKQHRSQMSPQINSQGPVSDLPRLYVADEPNMAAEIVSKVWEHFGFYQVKEGFKTKESLDLTKVICRLCSKQYAKLQRFVAHVFCWLHISLT